MCHRFLEGAAWDWEHSALRRQDPKDLVMEMPLIQVVPVEVSKLECCPGSTKKQTLALFFPNVRLLKLMDFLYGTALWPT